jgi:ubiquinone/menaquinone biosynthesis C-methylase UbiE
MKVYDMIGAGYNATRQADPYIAERLCALLKAERHGVYLDIGCGTGNYLGALAAKGYSLYGVDPSPIMLDMARANNPAAQLVEAAAESIPLPDGFFDGAIAVLTLHHWTDMQAGLTEVARVLKPGARLGIFSFTPEQMRHYWLYHYFPEMIKRCIAGIPTLADMKSALEQAGFRGMETERYFVQPDLADHFLYSNKRRPAEYLKEEVRNNISAFRLQCTMEELEAGLASLSADIGSGNISGIMDGYENALGDYMLLAATRR